MAVQSIRSDEHGGFLKQAFSKKLREKLHERWSILVKYCEMLNWIRAKWLGIDEKIVPVSQKIQRDLWGFQQQGCSAPREIDINDGEQQLFDVSSASTFGVWERTAEIETVIDIATSRWRLTSSEDSLRSCECSAACICLLAKLCLATFLVAEPANRL